MRCPIVVAALALLAGPLAAQSDSVATWPVGSRVRVWTSSDRALVGYLKEPRGDTLILEAPGSARSQTKLRARSVRRLEVSDGRAVSLRNVAVGTLGGALVSVGAVALFVHLLEGASHCTVDGGCGEVEIDYGEVALFGGAIGALAGALKLEDRWRSVGVPGRIRVGTGSRHTAVTLSFAFR
jgi:hypothetical protein